MTQLYHTTDITVWWVPGQHTIGTGHSILGPLDPQFNSWIPYCKSQSDVAPELQSFSNIISIGMDTLSPKDYVCYFSRNYFWKSNARSQDVLTENGFWHQTATQGHSRSLILQADKGKDIVI